MIATVFQTTLFIKKKDISSLQSISFTNMVTNKQLLMYLNYNLNFLYRIKKVTNIGFKIVIYFFDKKFTLFIIVFHQRKVDFYKIVNKLIPIIKKNYL